MQAIGRWIVWQTRATVSKCNQICLLECQHASQFNITLGFVCCASERAEGLPGRTCGDTQAATSGLRDASTSIFWSETRVSCDLQAFEQAKESGEDATSTLVKNFIHSYRSYVASTKKKTRAH